MSFIENIFKVVGIDKELTPLPYRAVILGDVAGYFENVKTIKSYNKEEIVLKVRKGEVTVTGEDLYIKQYEAGDIVINGKIKAVTHNA